MAVKDSTGDFQAIVAPDVGGPPDFEVYSRRRLGDVRLRLLGAVGVVSVASHLAGPHIRQMIELIETGDVAAARKIHESLSPCSTPCSSPATRSR